MDLDLLGKGRRIFKDGSAVSRLGDGEDNGATKQNQKLTSTIMFKG